MKKTDKSNQTIPFSISKLKKALPPSQQVSVLPYFIDMMKVVSTLYYQEAGVS